MVELALPCSISGAVNVVTWSDRAQFLNASVPVAESSREEGLMMVDMLLCPRAKEETVHNSLDRPSVPCLNSVA